MLVSSTGGNIAISAQQQAIKKSNMRIQRNDRGANDANLANISDNDSSDGNDNKVEEITKLRCNDVIMGRGGFTNNYVGNSNFRKVSTSCFLRRPAPCPLSSWE